MPPVHIPITRKEEVQLNLGTGKCLRRPRETEKPFLTRVPIAFPYLKRSVTLLLVTQ